MKITFRKICFCLGLLYLVISCGNTKLKKEYYDNGMLKKEYYVDKQGSKNGLLKMYYQSGKIELECVLKDNLFHGRLVHYFENGEIETIGNFVFDRPCGWFFTYDSSGYLKLKENIILRNKATSKMIPIYESFNDIDDIKDKEPYSNTRYYYINNQIIQDSSYAIQARFINYNDKINVGDSLFCDISIPYPYLLNTSDMAFMYKVIDSNGSAIHNIETVKKGSKISVPHERFVFKPSKKGNGYLYGIVTQYNKRKEGHDFYFKISYVVR